jgi:hypothetical protein
MVDIRCPECNLMLTVEEGEATGRLWCPGCGTLFQRDKLTGVITLFYEEKAEVLEKEDVSEAKESDDNAGGRDIEYASAPPGYIDIAGYEQRAAQENRKVRARWRLYCCLLGIVLGLAYGGIRAACDTEGKWEEILLRTLFFAPFAGCILGFIVASLVFSNSPVPKPEAPDFDEIAERLKEGIVCRRPRSASEGSGPAPGTDAANESNMTAPARPASAARPQDEADRRPSAPDG